MHFTEKKINRNDPCWCGSGKKYKNCHETFDEKLKQYEIKGIEIPPRKIIKTPAQIEGIRESAKINIAVLDEVADKIRIGMTTEDIDKIVYDTTTKMGGIPAPLNYEGFPKSVCTSLNNVVCHGIPTDQEQLLDGDIINVDVSTIYNGYFSDSSRMFCMGDVDPSWKRLVDVTKECVQIGIEHARPWTLLGDLGAAVHKHAVDNGYSVVREIGGHGCGVEFHEDPYVSYVSLPGTGMLLVPGMCFTIEPMVNMGTDEIFEDEYNGWTIYTDDDKPSAQWEVQVLITEDGCEVITY
ncbi:MAG: methionyl aminopeptidase [Lachnospiraceae bacterium]|nr:methionyl aminopeptidase [Lachnospiraceae bacterium]MDD6685307.1 methionyl aminopeptidase [Lachnospiraceae bacterium]MDD7049096.1 methionyl aminopeptidase [Lachnospiraceae bacterium]HBB60815.1 methionine aminopeptidase [Lachnospiraceae bacterium]